MQRRRKLERLSLSVTYSRINLRTRLGPARVESQKIAGTNTQAYYGTELITAVKSFMTQGSGSVL